MSDVSPARQEVLDALTAERYGPSLWWKTPPPVQGTAVLIERRRMLLELAEEADRIEAAAGEAS